MDTKQRLTSEQLERLESDGVHYAIVGERAGSGNGWMHPTTHTLYQPNAACSPSPQMQAARINVALCDP